MNKFIEGRNTTVTKGMLDMLEVVLMVSSFNKMRAMQTASLNKPEAYTTSENP